MLIITVVKGVKRGFYLMWRGVMLKIDERQNAFHKTNAGVDMSLLMMAAVNVYLVELIRDSDACREEKMV